MPDTSTPPGGPPTFNQARRQQPLRSLHLAGDAAEALRQFRQLLPDQERALGPHHPDTLSTRNNIAYWTGETGDAAEALRLYRLLLPEWEQVLGPHHPDTRITRGEVAYWERQGSESNEGGEAESPGTPYRAG